MPNLRILAELRVDPERVEARHGVAGGLDLHRWIGVPVERDDGRNLGHVVAVFGAGTMGHGIAQVLAQGGYGVRLFDLDGELLEAAGGKVRKNLEGAVKRGKLEADAVGPIMERLVLCPDLDQALGEATMVIEAIPERLELKKRVLSDAQAFFARLAAGDPGLAQHLDAVCVTTEGVSHFVYFVFAGARQHRPVSQVELELQAEIDKFLVLRVLCGLRGEGLLAQLYTHFELPEDHTPEQVERYRFANQAAQRYARWLDRVIEQGGTPEALEDARRLYRMPLAAKLERIERRAAEAPLRRAA